MITICGNETTPKMKCKFLTSKQEAYRRKRQGIRADFYKKFDQTL